MLCCPALCRLALRCLVLKKEEECLALGAAASRIVAMTMESLRTPSVNLRLTSSCHFSLTGEAALKELQF